MHPILNKYSLTASAIFFDLMNQQGSPCCHNFLTILQSYNNKVTSIGALLTEKKGGRSFSLFIYNKIHWDTVTKILNVSVLFNAEEYMI